MAEGNDNTGISKTAKNDLYVIPPFDMALSEGDRLDSLIMLCRHQAETSMLLDEEEAEERGIAVPWTPQEEERNVDYKTKRRQELERRVYKIFLDLETMAHRAQATWEIENQLEPWLDEDGNAITMVQQIEKMLPGEEERKSSGRAREKARFPAAARAFMDAGIPLETVVKCADTGKPTVLGVVASSQKKIEETTPELEDRREKYEKLIAEASKEQSISQLEQKAAEIVDPDLPEPPKIAYSVAYAENGDMWVVLKLDESEQALRRAFFARLKGLLELAVDTLFLNVIKFWEGENHG